MECKLFHPDRGESSFFSDTLTTILSELVREGCTKWRERADGMQSMNDDYEYVIIVPAYPNEEKIKKLQEKIRRFYCDIKNSQNAGSGKRPATRN